MDSQNVEITKILDIQPPTKRRKCWLVHVEYELYGSRQIYLPILKEEDAKTLMVGDITNI